MPRPYKCNICGISYAMDWARNNHQKLCKEKVASEMNPNRKQIQWRLQNETNNRI